MDSAKYTHTAPEMIAFVQHQREKLNFGPKSRRRCCVCCESLGCRGSQTFIADGRRYSQSGERAGAQAMECIAVWLSFPVGKHYSATLTDY